MGAVGELWREATLHATSGCYKTGMTPLTRGEGQYSLEQASRVGRQLKKVEAREQTKGKESDCSANVEKG